MENALILFNPLDKKIIFCVLSKLHNYRLKINCKMCFTRINIFARKTPKNHSNIVDLNSAVVRKGEKEEF